MLLVNEASNAVRLFFFTSESSSIGIRIKIILNISGK